METPFVWMRLVRSGDARAAVLQRAGLLTPYLAELIVDDARRGGRGVRLEGTLATDLGPAGVEVVRERLARLAGVDVVLAHRRETRRKGAPPGAAA